MEAMKVIFVLAAVLAAVAADCSVDGLQACLTEFLPLVRPSGIKLSEQSLARACMIRDDTLLCLDDFKDQCVATSNEELTASIHKTYHFINAACSPNSSFALSVKEYQSCFENASQKVSSCFNRTVLPVASDDDDSKWKAECCEYKEIRNCAVQTTEDACGPSASQLLHDHVTAINGLGLEVACLDVFSACQNAASLAAYSAALLLAALCSLLSQRCFFF